MARSIAIGRTGPGRSRGLLFLAIGFGLLSFVLAFVFLNSQSGDDATEGLNASGLAPEPVVVAKKNIEPGDRITADMVGIETISGDALQLGRFSDSNLVIDKTATTLILAGEQVVDAKISDFNSLDILSARIPSGENGNPLRGLGLTVPHESWIVGGLVQPGDRVDVVGITVLSSVDELTGEEKVDMVTGVIAEDIEVLAVSQTLTREIPNISLGSPDAEATADEKSGGLDSPSADATPAEGTNKPVGGEITNEGSFEEALSVTLALTPEQAAKVALIDALDDNEAQWRLIVRQRGDTSPVTGQKTWTINDIFSKN